MGRLAHLGVALLLALGARTGFASERDAVSAGVTTVSLRATVRLAPGAPVTLGSIAAIDGGQARSLDGLAVEGVRAEAGVWSVVEADAVRALIERSGVRSGSVVVRGARVNLTGVAERPERPALAEAPAPGPGVVTVRDHLESWLRSRFGVESGALRTSFDERDRAVLDTPTEGRVVEVRLIGVSSRTAVRVTVYERDTIVLSESLRVGIEVRKEAPLALVPLRRGDRLGAGSVEVRAVWVDPMDPPADPAALEGRVVRRAFSPGEIVRHGHLETPVMVERGQDVSVRTVRGSVVVTSIARARHDAGEGEIVELEAKDRSGRRFIARVAGPGRAVMIGQEVTP
jgi:flagella basal body P-ring formation protein FlgA